MEIALILGLITAAGIYLIFRMDQQSSHPRSHTWRQVAKHHFSNALGRGGAFQAVSLAPGESACTAVVEFGETRFLTAEAPPIPVQGCDCIECDCTYIHHDDRRKGGPDRRQLKDRRALFRRGDSTDRRKIRGRRRSDWSPIAA